MRQIISALLGAIALSIACVPGVLAANMPMKAPVAAPYNNWTGFYVGLNAGGGWGHSNDPTSATFNPTTGYFSAAGTTAVNSAGAQSTNTSGFTGGLQAGYNWQWANIVAGIEADFDYFGQKGSSSTSGVYPSAPSFSFTINSSASTNWLFTARPRLGMVVANNWLFYGTGGLAVTQVKANWSFTDNCNIGVVCTVLAFAPPTSASTSASATKAGWVVGGGVESALPGKLSLGVEYLYVNFGSISATNSNFISGASGGGLTQAFNHSADLTANIVRVRLNKQF